jgi:hypothetical protein
LINLTLEGNPIPFEGDKVNIQERARSAILQILPNLEILDDVAIASNSMVPNGIGGISYLERPSTAYGHRSSSPILSTVGASHPTRPTSSLSMRPKTNALITSVHDASSHLTSGQDASMAGNPILMLRGRRKKPSSPIEPKKPPHFLPSFSAGSETKPSVLPQLMPIPPKNACLGEGNTHRRMNFSLTQQELDSVKEVHKNAADSPVILCARRKRIVDPAEKARPQAAAIKLIDGI